MERLRDGQVKLGAAKYEQHAGSQRRIVNQIRTGTVTRHKIGALMGVSSMQG
jgi:hypothetical protein